MVQCVTTTIKNCGCLSGDGEEYFYWPTRSLVPRTREREDDDASEYGCHFLCVLVCRTEIIYIRVFFRTHATV